MTPVETFHWNPRRPRFKGRIGSRIPIRRRLNNFGDLLGPLIVNELVHRNGMARVTTERTSRLLSVGSVLHFAADGDVVWGTGVNGKFADRPLTASSLDVRAVRGPLTRNYLLNQGIEAPEVYGDPGLLVGLLWPDMQANPQVAEITVVMNFNDKMQPAPGLRALDPLSPVEVCLRTIASSSLVVGSSLHAIIIAESFGVPARLIRSSHEPEFKYRDYYSGTGRKSFGVAESIEQAIEMGGEAPPVWSPEALLHAFPFDLWEPKAKH